MKQSEVFLNGEGDNWYERNKHTELNRTVVDTILAAVPSANRSIEFGCGNGRYIGELHRHLGGRSFGIDPSYKALEQGRQDYPQVIFLQGTTSLLPYTGGGLDLILFGFCLYVEDRDRLPFTVANADRHLNDGGHIAIYDFDPEHPEKVPYKHVHGMFTYKMDYAALWLANPSYRLINKTIVRDGEAISVIKKVGWP